jgi:hypothetical protein
MSTSRRFSLLDKIIIESDKVLRTLSKNSSTAAQVSTAQGI